MHWRYRLRKQQLLDECEVPPEVFQGGLERLADYARPFAECLGRREQRDHARTYLAGLVSDLKHKTAESIAYRHGQERHGLQHLVSRTATPYHQHAPSTPDTRARSRRRSDQAAWSSDRSRS